MAEKQKKKSEEEVLFPEVEVGDIVVKPWSFGKLFDLAPILERVLDKAEEKGLMTMFDTSFISYATMARLFTIASPEVLEIISITINKKVEEIKELSMEDGIKIAVIIYNQNKNSIKNATTSLLQ